MDKVWLALLATLLGLVAFLPYLRATMTGTVRPHVLSWTIWGVTTSIVFLAQLQAGAGYGAWPVGASALIAFSIAAIAFLKRADIHVSRTDWLFFVVALSAIPLWQVTDSPLLAVIIVTTVDVLGFGPTLRKALVRPESESALFFFITVLRNLLILAALESYSVTTILFPIAIGSMAFIVMSVVLLGHRLKRRPSL